LNTQQKRSEARAVVSVCEAGSGHELFFCFEQSSENIILIRNYGALDALWLASAGS